MGMRGGELLYVSFGVEERFLEEVSRKKRENWLL
jgi:hypothetical protein